MGPKRGPDGGTGFEPLFEGSIPAYSPSEHPPKLGTPSTHLARSTRSVPGVGRGYQVEVLGDLVAPEEARIRAEGPGEGFWGPRRAYLSTFRAGTAGSPEPDMWDNGPQQESRRGPE